MNTVQKAKDWLYASSHIPKSGATEIITALLAEREQALAESQEAVAWIVQSVDRKCQTYTGITTIKPSDSMIKSMLADFAETTVKPLYTAPPTSQYTDAEILHWKNRAEAQEEREAEAIIASVKAIEDFHPTHLFKAEDCDGYYLTDGIGISFKAGVPVTLTVNGVLYQVGVK